MLLPRLITMLALLGVPALAQTAPATIPLKSQEGDYVVRNFRFTSGEALPELRLHYTTLGQPLRNASGQVTNAVLILHGTGGDGHQFFRPQFANVLFKPGGLLDPARMYVILPDDIGHGKSSKPSDGLHARFPHYGYADMVEGEYRLVADGLKVNHLRLVMGTSMGCMHSFMWGEEHPNFEDALMPLACLPVQIAGRNRMWRKMIIDAIEKDPAWNGGEYKTEPQTALRTAADILIIAGSAPLPMQNEFPTATAADKALDSMTGRIMGELDANDLLYQVAASRDYDPSKDLGRITARVMWVNSGDDFINPPELAIARQEVKKIPHGRFVLIPAGAQTHGHGTHTWAALWQDYLAELLKTAPVR
ncbi:MAG: alpha/beta fold hydrolase [Alphaproteobacteria bacterium]|nr:alpha/beta fold hydrolase [Alphaproteobacteria bacterium]